MKKISLTQGKFALVDKEDYVKLNKYNWCYSPLGYAVRGTKKNGKGKMYYLHRFIMKAKRGEEVDHINMNKLNNQRANLRIVLHAQNHMNKPIQKNNTSGYKGVSYYGYDNRKRKWVVRIRVDNHYLCIGYFKTAKEGALAYNLAATKYFGQFARLNNL